MPAILKSDRINYLPKHKRYHYAGALWLPSKRRQYEGEGIMDIIKMISNNKDLISTVASTTGNVIDAVGKTACTTIDTVKKIRELNQRDSVPSSQVEEKKVYHKRAPISFDPAKNGTGFFYLNK